MIGDRATSDWLTTSGDSLLRAAAGSRRRDPTFQQHAAPMHTYRGASPFCRCCRGGGVGVGGRGEGVQRGRGAEGRAQRGSSASCAPPPWPVPTEHVPDPATGTDKDPLDDPLDQMQQEGRRAHQQHRADPRQRSGSNSPRAQKNTYRKASQPIDDGRRERRRRLLSVKPSFPTKGAKASKRSSTQSESNHVGNARGVVARATTALCAGPWPMTRRSDGLRSALLAVRHRNPSIAAPKSN